MCIVIIIYFIQIFLEYVMEIETNLVPNTRIVINRQWNQEEENQYVPPASDRASESTRKSTSHLFGEEDNTSMYVYYGRTVMLELG